MPATRVALRDYDIRSYVFADAAFPRKGASLGDLIPASVGIGLNGIRAQAMAGPARDGLSARGPIEPLLLQLGGGDVEHRDQHNRDHERAR